ncbi:MAG: hypothetical protein ACOZAO_02480 [Patescibacteria group bacterium]
MNKNIQIGRQYSVVGFGKLTLLGFDTSDDYGEYLRVWFQFESTNPKGIHATALHEALLEVRRCDSIYLDDSMLFSLAIPRKNVDIPDLAAYELKKLYNKYKASEAEWSKRRDPSRIFYK